MTLKDPNLIYDNHTRDNMFILRTAGKHCEQSPARGLTVALMHSEPLGLLFKERLRGFKEPTSTVSIREMMFSIYSFSLSSESSFKEPKVAQELKTALDKKQDHNRSQWHGAKNMHSQLRSGALRRTPHLQKKTAICGNACGHRLNEWILFKVQSISSRLS